MQLCMFITGKFGCFHPANNRYPAKLIHQRIQCGGKGSGDFFFGNQLIICGRLMERLRNQIDSFFHRPAIAAEIKHIEVAPNPHMMCPQMLLFVFD